MVETGIRPDSITVDGGEGGTGAAPTEMTNSVGTPLRDALIFVNRSLIGFGLRDEIRTIATAQKGTEDAQTNRRVAMTWAQRLKRVFKGAAQASM